MPLNHLSKEDAPIYEPELGQLVFGNSYSDIPCPGHVVDGLLYLGEVVGELMGEDPPIWNTGGQFVNDVFALHAYYWGDCTCGQYERDLPHLDSCLMERPNFKCGDIEVSWYKHVKRGATINRKVSVGEFAATVERCLASLRTAATCDDFEAVDEREGG